MSDKCNVNIEHQTYKLGVRWTNKAFLMTLSLSTAPSRCIGGWGSILQHPRLYPRRRGHEAGTPDPRGCHQTSFQPRPDPWLAVISMKITLTDCDFFSSCWSQKATSMVDHFKQNGSISWYFCTPYLAIQHSDWLENWHTTYIVPEVILVY